MKPTEIWTFSHEPQKLEDIIVKENFRDILNQAIEKKPNLILYGHAGTGKGTFVNVFLKHTNSVYRKINASDETGVDAIRDKVKSFAQAMGSPGELKIVYLNEADHLSTPAQACLRDLIETVQKNTRFIFACNDIGKIIPEILSRCQVIEFSAPPAELIYKHCLKILDAEGIKDINKKSLVDLIKKCYPDIRRTINTLQQNSINGKFDTFVLRESDKINAEIFTLMKTGDIDKVREVVKSNPIDWRALYSYLYEQVIENPDAFNSPGDVIIEIADTIKNSSLIAIQEVNFMRLFFRLLKMNSFKG